MSTHRPRARPGATRRRSRPLPPGDTLYTPGASAARRAMERRSAAVLVYLHGLPAWLPPAVAAALLIAGLAVRGWAGGIALLAVGAFAGWLAAVSWPRLSSAGRLGRCAAVGCLVALAAWQFSR